MFTRVLIVYFLLCGYAFAQSSNANCVNCHAEQVADWQQSDHAKAMAKATPASVLSDFNNAEVTHFTQKALFYHNDNGYFIRFTQKGQSTDYKVSYTFGHYPLQEYLIDVGSGKLQVFPFAWDSRDLAQGGQRWYPMYADEDIAANDRLHWLQPLQNWNGMCADCHSDGLKRNYNASYDTFNTQFDNINVGCQSCHGEMANHYDSTQQHATSSLGMSRDEEKALGHWLLTKGEPVAHWQGPKRDNAFMDTCFSCHALRSPLTDGFKPHTPFLDQFTPNFITPPLYYADGQIKEEDYVYGSFLQSKMFANGVNCLDCHDQHTMKVKIQGNGLCLQCHNSEVYQQPEHIRHPLDSEGAQCVNCHMPQTTYMGVDARRDHSFRIPHPELSEKYGMPNGCTNCHNEESNNWAKEQIRNWHKNPTPLPNAEAHFISLMHGEGLPLNQHIALINDTSVSAIKRASALTMLPYAVASLSDKDVSAWVHSDEPLIRLALAQTGQLLPPAERLKSYQTLLNDKYKAIRVAAANQLVGFGLKSDAFKQAFNELLTANAMSTWRGEGNLNQSLILLRQQKASQAMELLKQGIEVDPYFAPNYVNLADIYRNLGQAENEASTLEKGVEANPASSLLQYSQGLYFIRSGDQPAALGAFKLAMNNEPANPQYAYVYLLTMDSLGDTKRAVQQLKLALKRYGNNPQLIQLGSQLAAKAGDGSSKAYFDRLLQGQ